jgi:YbbR domain-containing protein
MPGILENFWIKIMAILLAVLLWLHVVSDKTFQHEVTLELKQVDLGQGLILSEPPTEKIRILVSATGKTLLRSDWKKGGLKLAVNRTRPGRFRTELNTDDVSLIKSDRVGLVEIVSPREINLECDVLMESEVPVRSAVNVIPGEGYMVLKADSIVPGSVVVSGPRQMVRTIEYISTDTEEYKGIRNDLTIRIPLERPDIYNLELDPDTVTYFVSVAPTRSRIFREIAVQLINSPADVPVDFQPRSVRVRAAGLAGVIDTISPEMIRVLADYDQLDSNGYVPLEVFVPSSVTVLGNEPESVRVIEGP